MSSFDASEFLSALQALGETRNEATLDLGGQTFTLYGRPLTLAQMTKIDAQAKGDPFLGIVYTILEVAEAEDGSKAFELMHKPILRRCDGKVLADLAKRLTEREGEPDPKD